MIIIKPGEEPQMIKEKLDNFFRKIDELYPDKKVMRLHTDHKKLGEKSTLLYRVLGYKNNRDFFSAYGYEVVMDTDNKGGRPSTLNSEEILCKLKEKYKGNPIFSSITEIRNDNPEIAGNIKSLAKQSNEIYGKSLKYVFIENGILKEEKKKIIVSKEEKQLQELKRIEEEWNRVIEAITNKNEMPYDSFNQLIIKNPELPIGYLNNYSRKLFNIDGKQKLTELGIIKRKELKKLEFIDNINSMKTADSSGNQVETYEKIKELNPDIPFDLMESFFKNKFDKNFEKYIVTAQKIKNKSLKINSAKINKSRKYLFSYVDICSFDSYEKNSRITMRLEVVGTSYENRHLTIEKLKELDKVKLTREPTNIYNQNNIRVESEMYGTVGNLSSYICDVLAPLIDSENLIIEESKIVYIKPYTEKQGNTKQSTVYIEVTALYKEAELEDKTGCIICKLGGDQTRVWAQKLTIAKVSIPLKEAKLLFELYNRQHNEYMENDENYFYLGLDNLYGEVIDAHKKRIESMDPNLDYSRDIEYDTDDWDLIDVYINQMIKKYPERYGCLEKYLLKHNYYDFVSLYDYFSDYIIEERTYYWQDQCRISKEEWYDEFNHWYEVMELYSAEKELPFDMTDEDIVTIFGYNEFIDFADLSYGC